MSTVTKFVDDKELGEWQRVINTNLHGPAFMIYEVVPRMIQAGKAVALSTFRPLAARASAGRGTIPRRHITRQRRGLRCLRRRWLSSSVITAFVSTLWSRARRTSDLDKDLPPEAFTQIEGDMPMHRFGEPIEIGALCVFLSTDAANQMTGTINVHDGGLVLGG